MGAEDQSRLKFGDFVVALSCVERGTAAGVDGVGNEMLGDCPWRMQGSIFDACNRRFHESRDVSRACTHDGLKTFRVSWLRKNTGTGHNLSQFRPLTCGSVSGKPFMRTLLDRDPFTRLPDKLPFWGFRPSLSAQLLAFKVQMFIHTQA